MTPDHDDDNTGQFPSDLYVWPALVTGTSVVLCFIPLFNLLAFEFSFAISIPISLGAGLTMARMDLAEGWTRHRLYQLALVLLGAVVPICLNMFRVQNCNPLEGLLLFALFPVVSGLVSGLCGMALNNLTNRATSWFILIFAASLVWVGCRYYFYPPVDLYNPFLGYWPGAIYDDVFRITPPLLWSRAEDLILASAIYLGALAWTQRRGALAVMIGIIILGGVHYQARSTGVYRDSDFVQSALGGHRETAHFNLYFPKAWSKRKVDLLAAEFEFGHSELRRFFGDAPDRKITAYLYPDERTKKRLMGARRTNIAKPWQWVFHVNRPAINQSVIVHEMAHVFAAIYSAPPLHVPVTRYGLPQMALVEGIAEAAAWRGGRLDLHEWTSALYRLDLAPSMESLLSPEEFYGHNARTAYTLCGSLYRYVGDQFGSDAMTNAYRRGSFEGVGGLTRPQLVQQWGRFVRDVSIPESALAETRRRFDRPAIFGRICAREIAALRRQLRSELSSNERIEALSTIDTILGHLPRDVDSRLISLKIRMKSSQWAMARAEANALEEDEKAGGTARSTARETLADLDVFDGKEERAFESYSALLSNVFSRARMRQLAVKRAALSHPKPDEVLMYLTQGGSPKRRRSATTEIMDAAPDWPEGWYLHARSLIADGLAQEGLALLSQVSQAQVHHSIAFESLHLSALTLFNKDCFRAAERAFSDILVKPDLGLTANERADLQRWARRSTFFGEGAAMKEYLCRIDIDKNVNPAEDSQ